MYFTQPQSYSPPLADPIRLEFYADEDGCNYTLACDTLSGIPCGGGYALKLGPHDVCHSGVKYRLVGTLSIILLI